MQTAELPKAIECEKELLGSLLLLSECLPDVRPIVSPEHFIDPLHSKTYRTILDLVDEGKPLDTTLLIDRLKSAKAGNDVAAYLLEVTQSVTTAANAEYYAEVIRNAADARRVIASADEAIAAAQTDRDVEPVIERLVHQLETIKSESPQGADLLTITDAAEQYIQLAKENKSFGLVETKLPGVDRAIGGGIKRGEMVVISARPGQGKTAIALQITHAATKAGIHCLYITEEMSVVDLGGRLLQFACDIPPENWHGRESELRRALADHGDGRAPCFIASKLRHTDKVAREIRRVVQQKGVQLVVVDYCQLLDGPGRTEYERVSYASIVLSGLATELNIIVIAVCQTGRAMDERKHFVPIMSDIKGSGQFEQDASMIMFLVWPHRYDTSKPPHEYQFFIAKNRHRAIVENVVLCRFEPARMRVMPTSIRDMENYEPCFDDFENARPCSNT